MVRVMTSEEALRRLFQIAGNTDDRVKIRQVGDHLEASVRLVDSWTVYATIAWIEPN